MRRTNLKRHEKLSVLNKRPVSEELQKSVFYVSFCRWKRFPTLNIRSSESVNCNEILSIVLTTHDIFQMDCSGGTSSKYTCYKIIIPPAKFIKTRRNNSSEVEVTQRNFFKFYKWPNLHNYDPIPTSLMSVEWFWLSATKLSEFGALWNIWYVIYIPEFRRTYAQQDNSYVIPISRRIFHYHTVRTDIRFSG